MIPAKPTIYKGIQFRSRLEARWAKFFDEFGMSWQYEPYVFQIDLGDNCYEQYTPDFLIAGQEFHYVEVRGDQERMDREYADWIRKIEAIPQIQNIVLLGNLPEIDRTCWDQAPAFHAWTVYDDSSLLPGRVLRYAVECYAYFQDAGEICEFGYAGGPEFQLPKLNTGLTFLPCEQGAGRYARKVNSLLQRCSHVKFYD